MDSGEILNTLLNEAKIILPASADRARGDEPLPDLGFDSMSFVELLIAVEKIYGVRLMDGGMSAKDTESLRSLALCIEQRL